MKLYRTIVADPPWPIATRIGKGGRRRRETSIGYETMTLDEIAALPVATLADPAGAHLFLWAIDRYLVTGEALGVARAWGFDVCAPLLVWRKANFGMGRFPRPQHECVLICRRGPASFTENATGSVHAWGQTYTAGKVHSAKPDGFLDLVERVSPGPRVELFARRQRLGWDTWGDGALCHVDLTSLNA